MISDMTCMGRLQLEKQEIESQDAAAADLLDGYRLIQTHPSGEQQRLMHSRLR